MPSYFPIDRGILDSTLWIEGDSDAKTLWIWLLLVADPRTGVVRHTRPAIVHGTGIPREKIDQLLEQFASPDPDSRTPDNEGRRIAFPEGGGILLLNYGNYRNRDYSTPRVKQYDERNPGRKHRKKSKNNEGATGATQGQRGATQGNDEQEQLKNTTAPDRRDVRSEVSVLEARYVPGLPARAREACALPRRSGKMSDSVWLTTLQRLAAFPTEAVEYAMREMAERHADGDKAEGYMVAIARRKANGQPRPGPPSSSPPSAPVDFREHNRRILETP